MPLLNKKRFEKNAIPLGLKDTDRVFYCEATNEIFDNYQEFAERIILCNSLVWACEETGRSGLTYIEAVECEKNAKKLLNDFLVELRKPILYLVTLSNRSALSDLTEDIFMYVRERYFISEFVEYNSHGDHWVCSRILEVIAPSSKDLPEVKNGVKANDRQFWPPGSAYEYEIEVIAPQANGGKSERVHASASQLRRKKFTYTRDRNQLFIKHYVSKVDGIWKLKESAYKLYEVDKVRFEQIFAGPLPKFVRSDTPKKNVKRPSTVSSSVKSPLKNGVVASQKGKKQESLDKYLKPKSLSDKDPKSPKRVLNNSGSMSDNKKFNRSSDSLKRQLQKKTAEKRKNTEEIIERELLEKRKKMMEHQQQLIEKKQQKQLDSQRKRDEKKKLDEFVKEWNKTREDLELEDLQELPTPVPICLQTPNEFFGQLVMLYEFFQTFSEQVGVKNFFPAGVTIDLLDRALSQTELAGPLFDFIHLLLAAIFRLQEEEEDEIGESFDSLAISEFDSNSTTTPTTSTISTDLDPGAKIAAVAINCPLAFHGVPLQKLTIDATTISEVLRLHLLSSGARVSETCHRWRIQEKGGYVGGVDDPGVWFRSEHAHIIRALNETCVAVLPIADKIAILECLVHQVMMFAGVRDLVHENVDLFRQKRVELRTALAAEIKKEKELLQQRKKKSEKSTSGGASGEADAAAGTAPGANNSVAAVVEEMTDEQLEKAEKDVQRRKEDLRRQLAEITIDNLRIQLAPIGVDRAYRRFWVFPSVPGIFVEDHELNPPPCLPRGTPKPNLALMKEKDPLSYVRKLFQNEYNKENSGVAAAAIASPKKSIARASGSIVGGGGGAVSIMSGGAVAMSSVGGSVVGDGDGPEEPHRVAFSCWGDNDACPVHKRRSGRPRWSYYRTQGEFEKLLDALNQRGKRESKLRAMLTQYQEFVLKSMAHPFINLNPSLETENDNGCAVPPEIRKSSRGNPSYDNAMFDFPPDTKIETVLESLLRNLILDIEEKSNAGGLGCLKVMDRTKWLEAIVNNSYEQLNDALTWGPPQNESKTESLENDVKLVTKEKKYSNLEKFEILNQTANDINPKVKELAGAILQLEQSIELHYMKPPLGMEKTKLNKTGPSEILKRWEVSVMSSTSFAQLFLHLCTLDNSIAWNRSALNANCRICRRRGDPENMLLCDMCNKGHHMYCLKPKLTKVPKGDWFCPYCKPPVKEPSQKKKHVYATESDDEMDRKSPIPIEKMDLTNKGKCKTCGERGPTIGCSKCPKRYHLSCLIPPLRKAPTINWSCHSCRRVSARKEENHFNFLNTTLDSSGEPLRASRRKTSKAANEKIYKFVKQLRRPNSSDDELYGDESEQPALNGRGRSRRTRHNLESDYVGQLPLDNAALQELLNKIMHHDDAWPFLRPVSRFEAADYAQIVKRPMDFATIKYKLNMLQYHTNSQVISDSMLVFNNCFLYNKETSDVYQAGVRLLDFFRKLCEEMNFKKELQEVENQSKRFNIDDDENDDNDDDVDVDHTENIEMDVDEYEQVQHEVEEVEEIEEIDEEETEDDEEEIPATADEEDYEDE